MERAQSILDEALTTVDDYRDFQEGMIAKTGWCGQENCGHEIEDATGAVILGTPVPEEEVPESLRCTVCQERAKDWIYVSRTH